jgi:radical SAM protein (TIGR01212 family)
MSDDVLRGVNRGHKVADFAESARSLVRRGVDVGAHLIYGLPGDGRESFLAAAPFLSGLGVRGVKLHHFHVVKGAPFEEAWRRGEIPVPAYGEYVSACADFLERLSPEVAVMRMAGEAPESRLLAPRWGKGPREAARDVSALLADRGRSRGRCGPGSPTPSGASCAGTRIPPASARGSTSKGTRCAGGSSSPAT